MAWITDIHKKYFQNMKIMNNCLIILNFGTKNCGSLWSFSANRLIYMNEHYAPE